MSGFDSMMISVNRAKVRLLHRLLDELRRQLTNERDPAALIAGQMLRSQFEQERQKTQRLIDRNQEATS